MGRAKLIKVNLGFHFVLGITAIMADSGDSFFTNLVDHSQAVTFFCIVMILLILFKTCHNVRREAARNRISFQFAEQNARNGLTMGLDRQTVEALPEFVYKESQNVKDPPECAVCLSEFEENEKGRILPNCNHCFHTECIDMWFSSQSTCPLCRTEVEPNEWIGRNSLSAEEPISSNNSSAGRHQSIVYGHLVRGQRSSVAVQHPNSLDVILWVAPQRRSGGRILPEA